jgi:hypothetical protein
MQLIFFHLGEKKKENSRSANELLIVYQFYLLNFKWGALQGNAHFYVLFYFGVSEISTGGEF